jgi:hypothetical protein
MRKNKKYKILLFLNIILIMGLLSCTDEIKQNSKVVELIKKGEKYSLLVEGKPFYLKGAGLEFGNMESLKENGGNSFRTWRINNGQNTGKEVLDKAHVLGLMVCMGIEIGRERHGFNYSDSKAVKEQYKRVKSEVESLKDHPALLMWGIGNELNLSYTNPQVWDAVNEISKMIHKLDGNHPTTTMLAGGDAQMVKQVMKRATDLDFLSFQYYGHISNLHSDLKRANYKGAYVVSEWGATGHWEVPKTDWGRPIEENSHKKAKAYLARYQNVIQKDENNCLGSFVFLWGQKQERTPTWYGLFLESGEKTETVDAMHYAWNGKWPENRSPHLKQFFLNGQTAISSIVLAENQECTSNVVVTDPEGDALSYRWEVLKEVPRDQQSEGGDFEPSPNRIWHHDYGELNDKITFMAPKAGEYRLFIYVKDAENHVATANIPFLVNNKQTK